MDESTSVKDICKDVGKHVSLISSSMIRLENVSVALYKGQNMLNRTLCKKCRDAVKSKQTELHSKAGIPPTKKKLLVLSPERQHMLKELTNMLVQLERAQNEDYDDIEYCTEKEYYEQELSEKEITYTNKLHDIQDGMSDMEKKHKTEMEEKEAELRKVRTERDECKKKENSLSKKLKSYDDTEKALRELKYENRQLKTSLERKDVSITKLKTELVNRSYRESSSGGLRTRISANRREDETARLKEKLKDEELLISDAKERKQIRRESGNLQLKPADFLEQRLQGQIRTLKARLVEKQADLEKTQDEKDGHVKEISQLQKENAELQNQTVSFTETNRELSSTIDSLRRDIDKFTGQLEEKRYELDKNQKENGEYVKQITQLHTERQTLLGQVDSLHEKNEELKMTMEGLQLNIETLKGKLEEKQIDFEKTQQEKDEYVKDLSQQHKEKVELQNQTDSLTQTNKELSLTIEDLHRDIDKMTGKLEEKQNELDIATYENKEYLKSITEIQTERLIRLNIEKWISATKGVQNSIDKFTGKLEEKQHDLVRGQEKTTRSTGESAQYQTEGGMLQDQTGPLNRTEEDYLSSLESLRLENNRLTGKLQKKQEELDEIQKENEENDKKISKLEKERKTFMGQLRSIKYGMDEMSSNSESLQQDLAGLLGQLVRKDDKSSLEESRRLMKKVVVMKLLRTSRSGVGKTMMEKVTEVLTRQLGGRLDSRHFDFTIDLPETSAGVSKGPLFVVCLNSMVSKNVPDALDGPKGGRDVYLLVLHQTTRENVSTLRRTSVRNTGSEFRHLGGVIDMVFSSDNCLFECDFNFTAVEKIVTVLKK